MGVRKRRDGLSCRIIHATAVAVESQGLAFSPQIVKDTVTCERRRPAALNREYTLKVDGELPNAQECLG